MRHVAHNRRFPLTLPTTKDLDTLNLRKGSRHLILLTPRLRQDLQVEFERVYTIPRRNAEGALRGHGAPAAADTLSNSCPYTLDHITADCWP